MKAHNDGAISAGHPLAVANDVADSLAKQAARATTLPSWAPPDSCHDAVELLDASGDPVLDVEAVFPLAWWRRQRRAWGPPGSRPRLEMLFPVDVPINWVASVAIFARPSLQSDHFRHPVAPAVVKWVARVRSGCLATQARRLRCGYAGDPSCPCCSADEEDDHHLLAGCPATGSGEWALALPELWMSVARSCQLSIPPPPPTWLDLHHLPLTAALIPEAALMHYPLPVADSARFLRRLHLALAERLAELLSRRYTVLLASSPPASVSSPAEPVPRLRRPCPLPPERQLSIPDLRQLEVARRSAPALVPVPASVPPHGEARRLWLKARLLCLLADMVVCPASAGCSAPAILAFFESSTGEQFTVSPGTALTARATGIARVLGNLMAEAQSLSPPLLRMRRQGTWYYNRAPRVAMDADTWRRSSQSLEAAHPAAALHHRMGSVDSGFVQWIRDHRSLRPVPPERGECSMALLLLWEVDHNQPFPTTASADPSKLLSGFTRRLHDRVRREPDMAWFQFKDMHTPLARGLPPSHHVRWSVQVVEPPSGPAAAWYPIFVLRWQAYLRSLVDQSVAFAAGPSLPASAATAATAPTLPPCRPRPPAPAASSTRRAAPGTPLRHPVELAQPSTPATAQPTPQRPTGVTQPTLRSPLSAPPATRPHPPALGSAAIPPKLSGRSRPAASHAALTRPRSAATARPLPSAPSPTVVPTPPQRPRPHPSPQRDGGPRHLRQKPHPTSAKPPLARGCSLPSSGPHRMAGQRRARRPNIGGPGRGNRGLGR